MQDRSHSYSGAARLAWASAMAALMALAPATAHAAAAVPGAGNLLQQIQPPERHRPSKSTTGLRIEVPKAGISTSKVRFAVKRIEISGNTLFPTDALHGLVASGEGKQLTLGDLQRLARNITDYYHAHGYSLSHAGIPPQTVKGGVVRFKVVEAHFGKIELNNHSRVRDRLLNETLAPLKRGTIIRDSVMDRTLLLLSDIPGVHSSATVRRGSAVDTSDLSVDVTPTPLVTGNITANNYGNQNTGRGRIGAAVTINDPFHLGDALNLNLMTTGKGLEYGRAGYDVVVNGDGTRVGVSYSAMHYILGGTLSNLRGYGTARVGSAWVRQPLIRSQRLNLYARAQFDNKRLRDHIDASATRTDRHLNDGAFSISGDAHDQLLHRQAVNTLQVMWTTGRLSIDDPSARAADAATAKTAGHFSMWNVSATRMQGIDTRDSLYLMFSGQWAPGNLDSVEKSAVGGTYTLRGYDMGALSADTSYLGTVELRHQFSARVQGRVFYDAAQAKVNAKPWSTGQNTYTLSDAGLGLDVDMPHRWHVQGFLARPVGKVPADLTKRTTMRGWVQLSKAF